MFTDTGSPVLDAAPAGTVPHTAATGPKTPAGKRIAARNATTHGLFARDVVLTHLGEDPEGYKALLQELTAQLHPQNLLEQHYAEKIAAASWRLRRLQRWQAQLFEDPDITEDEALSRLDRVMRHETALHRQIDTSVKMLGRELPRLFQDRVRADLIRDMNATEKECREDPAMNEWITGETRRRVPSCPVPAGLDPATLDAAPAQKCQNGPARLLSRFRHSSCLTRNGGGGEERAGGGSVAGGGSPGDVRRGAGLARRAAGDRAAVDRRQARAPILPKRTRPLPPDSPISDSPISDSPLGAVAPALGAGGRSLGAGGPASPRVKTV